MQASYLFSSKAISGLEKLLNRQIDLLEERSLKNTFLRMNIDNSKKMIYGA